MADNSEPKLIPAKNPLKRGRRPALLKPTIFYRIEQVGVSSTHLVPKGWRPTADRPDPPTPRRRGRPGPGYFLTFVGGNAMTPRPGFLPRDYRIVKLGRGYSVKDASARAEAWLRVRLVRSTSRSLRRARAVRAAGAQTSDSGSASRAK